MVDLIYDIRVDRSLVSTPKTGGWSSIPVAERKLIKGAIAALAVGVSFSAFEWPKLGVLLGAALMTKFIYTYDTEDKPKQDKAVEDYLDNSHNVYKYYPNVSSFYESEPNVALLGGFNAIHNAVALRSLRFLF